MTQRAWMLAMGLACAGAGACRTATSPSLQALPLTSGAYTLTVAEFRTANLPQTGLCVLPPAGFTVVLSATVQAQGNAWIGLMTTPLIPDPARISLDPWDGQQVTGRASGTAVAAGTGGSRGVSFGDASISAGSLSATKAVSGLLGGDLRFTWSDGLNTWICSADRASFELKRVE